MGNVERCSVAIIGAGPSGALAAAILSRAGHDVVVLEREVFPRFSIGESLLPQSMEFLEDAGLLEPIEREGFQLKNGAAFERDGLREAFNFEEKFSAGWGTTFQVQRARFDEIVADGAAESGADIRYQHEITAVDPHDDGCRLTYQDETGAGHVLDAQFCLDASGFGRVLPRHLGLDRPSDFPVRRSLFTHIRDEISDTSFDRNKILITVHPKFHDVWFWLIPFSDGTSSLGVVAREEFLAELDEDEKCALMSLVDEVPNLRELLAAADYHMPVRSISGFSSKVSSLYGKNYALLGNAGEFLDPVFSSGVTIALKSASLAANNLCRMFAGQEIDWEKDFSVPLGRGVETFRQFVSGWYSGELQDVIFASSRQPKVQGMICSILAGYAWDVENPYVAKPRRLKALAEMCRSMDT